MFNRVFDPPGRIHVSCGRGSGPRFQQPDQLPKDSASLDGPVGPPEMGDLVGDDMESSLNNLKHVSYYHDYSRSKTSDALFNLRQFQD